MKKNKQRVTSIGKGYSYDRFREEEIYLDDAVKNRHLWCFGTTGVGKTRLLEYMAVQDIRKGYSVFILDPKNDAEILNKVVQSAASCGRLDDLSLMTPVFPQYSCKLNPLEQYYMKEEIVANILSGVEVGREPFFYNVANESTTAIVHALLYLREKAGITEKLNFEDIKDRVSSAELGQILLGLKEYKDDSDAKRMIKDLTKVVESGQDYYSKISSSLRVALMDLTTGNTGLIMGNVRGNKIIERLESGKGVIFLAQLGSLLTSKTASTVSRVLISMLKTLAGRTYAFGKVLNPPLVLYADEAHNLLFHGFETMISQVGSANFSICGFSQSINQIYAVMGDLSRGKSIIDNINTKIYMRAPDEETAQYASEHFGTVRNLNTILNINGTANFREVKEEQVKKEVFLSLKTQEFLMTTHSGRYMGRTATTEQSLINIIYPQG